MAQQGVDHFVADPAAELGPEVMAQGIHRAAASTRDRQRAFSSNRPTSSFLAHNRASKLKKGKRWLSLAAQLLIAARLRRGSLGSFVNAMTWS